MEAVVHGKATRLNAPPTQSQAVNRKLVITNSPNSPSGTELRAMGNETSKADFSHVQSQIGSTADKAITYTVVAGDNLTKIAKHFYGNANAWKQVFDANRDQLSDPDRIRGARS
jgi:Uncharacterized protein containing LysM domain